MQWPAMGGMQCTCAGLRVMHNRAQVGKHFEGKQPGRMAYVPNAYLRYRYPEDWPS